MTVWRVAITPLDAGVRKPLLDICRQRIGVLGLTGRVADFDLHAVALLFAEPNIIAEVFPEIIVLVRHREVNAFDGKGGAVQGFCFELNGFRADGDPVQHNTGGISVRCNQDAIF